MTIIVEFNLLSKKIHHRTIIDCVTFKLVQGEVTTLIGQNGSGKTTIAKVMLGQETYTSGQCIVKDNIRIGYIPQKLDTSFNMPITSKLLLEILSPGGINNDLIDLETFVGYSRIQHKDISSISGGELQKLLISGTLMSKPDLLILDEPTQFLDVTSQQEFYKILGECKEKFGITIFMISHDLFTIMKNSDQVICLNGKVCCTGKLTDIETNSDFKNALSEIGVYLHNH